MRLFLYSKFNSSFFPHFALLVFICQSFFLFFKLPRKFTGGEFTIFTLKSNGLYTELKFCQGGKCINESLLCFWGVTIVC